MEIDIDSITIANNPKNFKSIQNGLYDYYREPHCENLLREKFSLENNQWISDYFLGDSNDELKWNDSIFLCGESPLSDFKNYKELFPNVEEVFVQQYLIYNNTYEKNYWAKWTIIDNKLYLFDIVFINNDVDEKININRLKDIEKLTGKKFAKIASFDQKVIFADWYNGSIHLKRYPIEVKYIEGCDHECYRNLICNYKCEPFDKITFEKGKIKSIEKVNYMIHTRNE